MADVITQTNELWIELKDSSGDYTRTLRLVDPSEDVTSRSEIINTLAPLFPTTEASGAGNIVPFFFDDANPDAGLTQVGTIQRVQIQKTVHEFL